MSDLLTLSCPSCAGLLSISEGSTNTVCIHCDTPLLLQDVVRRYIIESQIDSTEALRSVRKKLEEVSSRGVFSSCRVRKPFLAYVPFWLISSRVDGYVFGVKPVYREKKIRLAADNDDGGAQRIIVRTIKQRKGVRAEEHQISNGIDMIVSAARLEPLGIPSLGARSQLGLSGMALGRAGTSLPMKVFDSCDLPEGANVVDPSVPIITARSEADEFVSRLCEGAGSGLEQRSMYLAVTGTRERMVHYPLWVVDYSFSGRTFRIVVDGGTGGIVKGTFPADTDHWKKVCRILGSIWAGLFPVILLIMFSRILVVGPFLMLFLLSLWGMGAISLRFLKLAGENAETDSYI